MKRLPKLSLAMLLGAPLLTTAAAEAQLQGYDPYNDARDPATAIRLNLSTPGARSLAMGGAFLGLADDATAAYTNPAGLTNLALGGSEVAVEVRQTRFTTSFTDRGHYGTDSSFFREGSVAPNRATFIGLDSIEGLPPSEAESDTSGLSFLSVGYVLPGGLTLAVYRHELGNFESSFESQGPFVDFDLLGFFGLSDTSDECAFFFGPGFDCNLLRILPRRSRLDLEIVNYGVSAAYAFDLPPLKGLESNLALGLGLSYYELELDMLTETFGVCHVAGFSFIDSCTPVGLDNDRRDQRVPGSFFGPADFSIDNHFYEFGETASDRAVGFSLGFLWKLGRGQKWSVGGVFREGPEFETKRGFLFGHHPEGSSDEFVLSRQPAEAGSVTVPDVFGLGVAFRTADGSTKIALDVNHVGYSKTVSDFTPVCFPREPDETTRDPGEDCDPPPEQRFRISDVTQVHLGLERTVLVVDSLFVGTARVGAWHEPSHEPEYQPVEEEFNNQFLVPLFAQPAEDEIHLSVGLGLVIKEDYQVDLAVDISDPVTTVSFSLVKFF